MNRTMALAGALLAGCVGTLDHGEVGLVVEQPRDGAVVGSTRVRVAGLSHTEVVRVNDREVPVTEGRFDTTVELAEGAATIEVVAADVTRRVPVTVDTVAPEIAIESPLPPALVEGDRLRVVGRVIDATAVALSADGEPVEIGADGRFVFERAVAPGAHRARLTARDAAGHTVHHPVAALVGRFAPYAAPVEDAAALTLGAPAFEELSRGLTAIMNGPDVRQELRAGLVGDHGDVTIESVEYARASIAIAPVDGGLAASATVEGVHVAGRVRIDLGLFDITKRVSVTVDALAVNAHVLAWAEGGVIRTGLVSSDLQAHGVSYDVSGVPGFVEGFFRGTVRDLIESNGRRAVTGILERDLPARLASTSLEVQAALLGTPLAVEGTFRELALDPTGMHVRVDVAAWSDAATEARMATGPIVLGHRPLARAPVESVAVEVTADAINAVSHAVWSGFVPVAVPALPSLGSGDLDVGQLALATAAGDAWSAIAAPDARVEARIDMGLPPVLTIGPDGDLVITCADARIELLAAGASPGEEGVDERAHLVTLSAYLSAPIELAPGPDGRLALSVGEVTLRADALDPPHARFAAGEALDELVGGLAPLLAAGLLDLGGLALPTLAGFGLVEPRVEVGEGVIRLEATLAHSGDTALP